MFFVNLTYYITRFFRVWIKRGLKGLALENLKNGHILVKIMSNVQQKTEYSMMMMNNIERMRE